MNRPDAEEVLAQHARRACEDVVLAFVRAFDDGRPESMLGYFAPDGIWERADGTVVGHDGLMKMMAGRSQTLRVRHVITNMITTLQGGDAATVTSYVTVYRHDGAWPEQNPAPLRGPALVGEYTDQLRRTEGGWKISHKRVQAWFKTMEEKQ